MKNILKAFGLALALITTSAHAIPTLFFDGDMSYSASTGGFSVTSVLTATEDISPAPELIGSELTFSAVLGSVIADTRVTTGLFDGVIGNDIQVTDGDLNDLLVGEFLDLEMMGRNGRDSGMVSGTVNATGGSLAEMFGAGNLIALQFNLSTVFSADMYDTDFVGHIDGRIEGESVPVPEPNILALFGFGLLLVGFARPRL